MTDETNLMPLKTRVSAAAETGQDARQGPHQAAREGNLPLLGLFAVGFAVLSIFTFAPVFVPLGLILGVIALFIGQIGLGLSAIVLSMIGILTSPTLMALASLGAAFAWLGL